MKQHKKEASAAFASLNAAPACRAQQPQVRHFLATKNMIRASMTFVYFSLMQMQQTLRLSVISLAALALLASAAQAQQTQQQARQTAVAKTVAHQDEPAEDSVMTDLSVNDIESITVLS